MGEGNSVVLLKHTPRSIYIDTCAAMLYNEKVIYAGQFREDAYALVRRTLNIPRLEPHLYAETEQVQAETIVERMCRDGIPIELD